MTALCKTFSNSIQLIEYKEKKLENDVASALTFCNSKIEEINEKLNNQRFEPKVHREPSHLGLSQFLGLEIHLEPSY